MMPIVHLARRIASRVSRKTGGFSFDRPLVLLQSDDWGRVGVRDREGWDELHAAGLALGQHPYDYYSLETADDVAAIHEVLTSHRDSEGRTPRLVMNFCVANLDFERIAQSEFQSLFLQHMSQGPPGKWNRPGLLEAYRQGIAAGVFYPALHGATHFCRAAMERHLNHDSDRGRLLRTLWQAETPYIHWRTPWIGFEYWDRERTPEFLPASIQHELVREAAARFVEWFRVQPLSACAPGYRAHAHTHRAWSGCGIRVAQNGPSLTPPHFDGSGLLHTYRTLEIEPALDPRPDALERCLQRAAYCFDRGLPAIVSLHSINFHSTLKDFRSTTLRLLDQFLAALEHTYRDLVYLHDLELHDMLQAIQLESAAKKRSAVHVQTAPLVGGMQ